MDIMVKSSKQAPYERLAHSTLGFVTPNESRNNLEGGTTQPVSRPSSQQSERKKMEDLLCSIESIDARPIQVYTRGVKDGVTPLKARYKRRGP